MENIKRYDVVFNRIDEITLFDSELTRWLKDNGADTDDLMKVKADVPKTKDVDLEEERVHGQLMHYVSTGMAFSKKVYKVVMVTASDSRKATTTWINEKLIPELGKWGLCGLQAKDIVLAVNKFMAYMGLLASASKRFKDVLGKDIDIRRVVVVKDYDVMVNGLTSFVATERNISEAEARQIVIDAFDGMGIINEDLTKGESMTLRGPWIKTFVQAVNWNKLKKYLDENGIEPKLTDFWGREVSLEDVDVILTASCFKAAKLYKSWEQYCNAFEMLGHKICVCVREHAMKKKGMPYQQGQTLMGTEADAMHAAFHAADTVRKYSAPHEAAGLLPKWQRLAARKYPALLNETHTKRTIQEKYTSKRNDMRGGRIPELGYNAFVAADIVALIQWIFGQPVTGFLKAGECFCTNCKPGEVDITRNPHMDNAHVVLNNVEKMPLAIGPTMFINIFDLTTLKLRCDYDGDHVWYSQDAWLLDLVHRTYEKLGDITFDWVAPAGKKVLVTKNEIANFVSNLMHGSEIGLYTDALTKMWNTAYDRDICGWLTYGANVIIDAAKHGEVDKRVMEILRDILKEMSTLTLPEFCRFAKADKEHPADSKYWTEDRIVEFVDKKTGEKKQVNRGPRVRYSGSFLDMYSRNVEEYVPAELKIEDIDDVVFDTHIMLINPDRKIGKLAGLSCKAKSYNPDTGEYEDGGVFQKIAFRHAAEWKKMIHQDGFKMNHEEWEEAKKNEAIKEMIVFARNRYSDNAKVQALSDEKILEGIYDVITRNVFNTTKVSEGYDTVVKNAYWRIFGEMAYKVICANVGETVEEFNPELFEDYDLAEIVLSQE